VRDAQVKAADAAPVLVSAQHPFPKAGGARAPFRVGVVGRGRYAIAQFTGAVKVQAQRGPDVGVQRRWEAGIGHPRRHRLQQVGNVAQGLVDIGREACLDAMLPQFAQTGRIALDPPENLLDVLHLKREVSAMLLMPMEP